MVGNPHQRPLGDVVVVQHIAFRLLYAAGSPCVVHVPIKKFVGVARVDVVVVAARYDADRGDGDTLAHVHAHPIAVGIAHVEIGQPIVVKGTVDDVPVIDIADGGTADGCTLCIEETEFSDVAMTFLG